MAEFDGMNSTPYTPSATETGGHDHLDVPYNTAETVGGIGSTLATGSRVSDSTDDCTVFMIISAVTSIIIAIGALAGFIALIYKCCKGCRQRAGNGQQPSTSEERVELNPLNADTGNDGLPLQEPASFWCVGEGTVLQLVQEQLQNVYKTLFIPKGPVNPSRSIAEVDELYTELKLLQAIEESFNEDLTTRDKKIPVRKPRMISLDSWRDLLNPDKIWNLMIILSGGAGFGKSTLFKRIAHTWATSNQLAKFKLLFLIELKRMKTSSIIDAILDQCFLRDERPDRDDLIRIITDNQSESVFLLDGLDELQPRFLELNSEDDYCVHYVLHKRVLQQSRVLVATRPHKVAHIIEGYPRSLYVETSGFTKENTEQYISKYFRDNEDKERELIEIMKTKKILRQLAHLPVICQIVCHIFKFGESQLPDRLAQLYQKFMEVLAQRRCGEDWKQRLESALKVLGRVALDGLLDNRQPVLTNKEFGGCASVLNDASEESGFIQQKTYESVDSSTVIVTFLHMTFQEYCAAYYFVNLYHADEKVFHEKLKQIHPDNVHALESLLRFACGISSGSPATELILKHVQKQCNEGRRRDEVTLQKLVRLMLFESGSDEMADKLDRPTEAECDMADKLYQPTEADCDSQEDLLAMRYYLQCLRQPLVGLYVFDVRCRSHDELALLRDINDLLLDKTAVIPHFRITCRSHEDLTLLREMLKSGNIRPIREFGEVKLFKVTYIMSEQPTEEVKTLKKTLEEIDGILRGQIELTLEIDEKSGFDDDCVLSSRVCNQIQEVDLRNRTYDDVSRLGNALGGSDRLKDVSVSDTNLHGRLADVASIAPQSLSSLKLDTCGLIDDDVPDLISILPAGHGLRWLVVPRNEFSLSGVTSLTDHLRRLPRLQTFWLDYSGPDADSVKQVVMQNLPNITYV